MSNRTELLPPCRRRQCPKSPSRAVAFWNAPGLALAALFLCRGVSAEAVSSELALPRTNQRLPLASRVPFEAMESRIRPKRRLQRRVESSALPTEQFAASDTNVPLEFRSSYSIDTTAQSYLHAHAHSSDRIPHHRHLQERRSILVIRIVTQAEDAGTTETMRSKLQSVLYDGLVEETSGTRLPSVHDQMISCSAGAVRLEPATPHSILTVTVSSGGAHHAEWVEAAATVALPEYYGIAADPTSQSRTPFTDQLRNLADHIVVILPQSYPDASFLATAEIEASLSIYAVDWATSLSAYMHELAHNIGLRHSRNAATLHDEYGDTTGYMGRSIPVAWVPQRCFNAAQHWSLGWYPDALRMSLVGSTTPIQVTVGAFVDHSKLSASSLTNPAVVVQLNDGATYLQFNRAKSYNTGTDMMQNQVTIIQNHDGDDHTVLMAGLDMDNPLYDNGQGVVVRVCQVSISDNEGDLDYVILAIGPGAVCTGVTESLAAPDEYETEPHQDESVASPFQDEPTTPPQYTLAPVVAIPMTVPTLPPTLAPLNTASPTGLVDEPDALTWAPVPLMVTETPPPTMEKIDRDATTAAPVPVPTLTPIETVDIPSESDEWTPPRPTMEPTKVQVSIDTDDDARQGGTQPSAPKPTSVAQRRTSPPSRAPIVIPPTTGSTSESKNRRFILQSTLYSVLGFVALMCVFIRIWYVKFWRQSCNWQPLPHKAASEGQLTATTSVFPGSSSFALPHYRTAYEEPEQAPSRSSGDGSLGAYSGVRSSRSGHSPFPFLPTVATSDDEIRTNPGAWSPSWAELPTDDVDESSVALSVEREAWRQRVDDILHSIGWMVREPTAAVNPDTSFGCGSVIPLTPESKRVRSNDYHSPPDLYPSFTSAVYSCGSGSPVIDEQPLQDVALEPNEC